MADEPPEQPPGEPVPGIAGHSEVPSPTAFVAPPPFNEGSVIDPDYLFDALEPRHGWKNG